MKYKVVYENCKIQHKNDTIFLIFNKKFLKNGPNFMKTLNLPEHNYECSCLFVNISVSHEPLGLTWCLVDLH